MHRGAIYSSVALHVAVILLAVFGLPHMLVEPPEPERPIVVELAQIGDITNPPPAPQPQAQKEAEQKPEPPKPEPKPEPQKAPPPPPPPPKPAEPPPPQPDAVTLPSKDKKKPEEKKPEEPKPSPLSEVKPKKKPEPPQDDFIKNVLKSVEKPKPQAEDFDKMMKKLTESAPKQDEKPKTQTAAVPQKAGSPTSSLNQQYTITEQDFIRAYIQKNWNPPVGAKEVVAVQVSFTLRSDGTITDVRLENQKSGDALWQSFADSARRAVLLSSPIPIPVKPGRTDDRVIVNFDPREMMGYSKPR